MGEEQDKRATVGDEGDLRRAYELLGLRPGADLATIRKAWRALVRSYHPDTVKGDKEAANARLVELNQAYEAVRSAQGLQESSAGMRRRRLRRKPKPTQADTPDPKDGGPVQIARPTKVLTPAERAALQTALAGFSAAQNAYAAPEKARRSRTEIYA